MKNRREFLAILRGAAIGASASLLGMNINRPDEPIHVPDDRLPMVTTTVTTGNVGSTVVISERAFSRISSSFDPDLADPDAVWEALEADEDEGWHEISMSAIVAR